MLSFVVGYNLNIWLLTNGTLSKDQWKTKRCAFIGFCIVETDSWVIYWEVDHSEFIYKTMPNVSDVYELYSIVSFEFRK